MKLTSKPLAILLIIFLMLVATLATFAKPPRNRQRASVYWEYKVRTVSGKHTYHLPRWGNFDTCKSYNNLPIKAVNHRRYHFYKGPKNKNNKKYRRAKHS